MRISDEAFGAMVSLFWCAALVAIVAGIVWLFT